MLPTEAEIRRRKKQDEERVRVALWLTPGEAAMLDRYKKAWGLPSRIAALRKLFLVSRRALKKKTLRKSAD